MLQLAEIQEFKRVAPAENLALSIVHDLRNPLSAISGCAELLASATLDAEQTRRIATNVWRASERMKSLLTEFVATAREKKERWELCSLRAVLAASRDEADVSQRTDIDLTIDVSPDIDLQIDCRRMQSVFWNLIVNAMEAMPGGGAIHIAASAVSNRVQITVEDTGPGLPATIRDRLFEPFVTAGKAGGVGLGLAISRETVRCHGGDLWSEPARGARFVMWLPRHKRANRQKESQ